MSYESIPEFGIAAPGVDYILRPGGYLVVKNAEDEIATLVTPMGVFLPGGGLEIGESTAQAAIREAVEECGLRVKLRSLIGTADELVFAATEGVHYRKRCVFFNAEFLDCDEGGEDDHQLVWLSIEEAASRLTHKSQVWAVTIATGVKDPQNL